MSFLQFCVLATTVVVLIWLTAQTLRSEPEPVPRNALIYLPHQCPVCGRGYRDAQVLHFHLYGLNGTGQHGRLEQIIPLAIDGEACVGVPRSGNNVQQ